MQKYVPEEVELDDDQHDEMCRIHSAVEDHANEDLQQVLRQVPDQTTRDTLMQAWENDRRRKFAADQEKNGNLVHQQLFLITVYCKSGNFRCKNIFVVDGSYEN